jgi:hypothetical protein
MSKRAAQAKGTEVQTLNFVSDEKQIMVQNQISTIPSVEYREVLIADTFAVNLLNRNENIIEMEWYPNFDISGYLPNQIELQVIDEKIMQLQFGTDLNYIINLAADSLKAIRIK